MMYNVPFLFAWNRLGGFNLKLFGYLWHTYDKDAYKWRDHKWALLGISRNRDDGEITLYFWNSAFNISAGGDHEVLSVWTRDRDLLTWPKRRVAAD